MQHLKIYYIHCHKTENTVGLLLSYYVNIVDTNLMSNI
jgi:hypothetical protein